LKTLCRVAAVLGAAAVAILALVSCGSGNGSGPEGGTLTGTYSSFPDFLDPALSYTQEGWTAMYATYIPLLTYARADGAAGGQVIPGLAKSMPKIGDDGKSYTLFLRPGLKYSNGEPVRASDFTHTLERTLKLSSPASPFYENIVGAEKFATAKSGGIPGIETNDKSGEIVIHLVKPQGTFNNVLGMMLSAPLPPGTPAEDLSASPPPATGPYVITKSQPGRGWEYARNPEWAKANGKAMPEISAGHFNKIKITVVSNDATQVHDVEQGKFDWMQPPPSPDLYPQVKAKFEGTQFRVEKTISNYYFWMNTTRPPFNDPEVRKAVNYAVDSKALEKIYTGQLAANQQVLPPGMPGHEKLALYPHNMAKAKEMIAKANPSDRDITVWGNSEAENREATEYYDGVLKELGFNAKLKIINAANYFTVIGNQSTPDLDTGWLDWFQDYPNPNDFFQPLLSGESIQPNNNLNASEIDVPKLNEKIARLGEEPLGPKQEAEYAELDKSFMELAPWAPYGSRTTTTFVSSAIDLDKVIFNPTFGQDLTSFQLK
jgi:peptide/nickel transport system substrate-binding protein